MRYSVKKVRSFDEWKKETGNDEEMIFPAMLTFGIGGSAVVSSIDVLGGASALYGLSHTMTIICCSFFI